MILAGTGHRPEKLGGYSPLVFDKLVHFAEQQLDRLKPDEVISGMALGWDMALAFACMKRLLPFTAAVPFVGQENRWPDHQREKYKMALDRARRVVVTSEGGYEPWKMQIRNQWMVDNCDTLLALFDGSSGGTANCLKYAEKIRIKTGEPKIDNCWKLWLAFKQSTNP